MSIARPILVFEEDHSVLASLQFALSLEGYRVVDGEAAEADPQSAACLIIEQRFGAGDGLALLAGLRAEGVVAPAILLATNPTGNVRERAEAAGVVLIEKPLLSDGLTQALRSLLHHEKAA